MAIDNVILNKIDIFMKENILIHMNPNKIFWWISLSGGKDSYTMARALYMWYQRNGYTFNGEGIFINQWGKENIFDHLCKNIDWIPINMINAVNETYLYTNYEFGIQAPCSKCSQVRKNIGDEFIHKHYQKGYYNIMARGLHLTDMAISYLWRNFWNIDTTLFATKQIKGKPFERLPLNNEMYLSKPLFLVREFECEKFSDFYKYKPVCCGCPACAFPSRRDIVEESLRQLFDDGLWELKVNGINMYLNSTCSISHVEDFSLSGRESKCFHLTADFIEYALGYWNFQMKYPNIKFDTSSYLDDIGSDYLVSNLRCNSGKIYIPKLLSNIELTEKEKRMIATVGPFWGAIGYANQEKRNSILKLQSSICNIEINTLWSQVNLLLQSYYKLKGLYNEKNNKYSVYCCGYSSNSNCSIPNI